MHQTYTLAFLLLASACSSRGNLSFNSSPAGATVSSVSASGETVKLGTAPLVLEKAEVVPAGSSMVSFVIEKEGFEKQSIFLGLGKDQQNYDFNLKLQPKVEDSKGVDLRNRQERLAKNLITASGLISGKKYDDADRLLQGLVTDYPYVSVSYDLLGNISYLRKDFREAARYYKRSLEINPENLETRQVLDRLEQANN